MTPGSSNTADFLNVFKCFSLFYYPVFLFGDLFASTALLHTAVNNTYFHEET